MLVSVYGWVYIDLLDVVLLLELILLLIGMSLVRAGLLFVIVCSCVYVAYLLFLVDFVVVSCCVFRLLRGGMCLLIALILSIVLDIVAVEVL